MSAIVQGVRERLLVQLGQTDHDGQAARAILITRGDAILIARILEQSEATERWLEQMRGFVLATKSEPGRLTGL